MSFTDDADTAEGPLTSELTDAVIAANTAATGQPSISGIAQVGEELTAAKGTIADANGTTKADADDTGYAYTYQWIRVDSDGSSNPTDIGTDSSTYTLVAADLGKKIKVEVSFTDDDDFAETRTSAVTITVTDVNTAPTFPSSTAARSVAENTAAGQNVGAVLTATDADNDTLTYTLEGTDATSFDLVTISGSARIRTKSGVTYDHETKSSYAVTVKADDSNGGTDTIAVTITVTDVNEPPGPACGALSVLGRK